MLLDIDKFCNETIIENEHLPEITSSSIRQSNGLYDPRGLFSTEFFGAERSRKWNTMFGKLVIPHPVIHPAIYYIIKRNISYLLRWIKLDIGFVQEDNELILTNVSNNYAFAGIVDLYQNSQLVCDALIKTKKFETETARKILGYIVQRNIPIFTSNVIVMPPGYRPVNGDARASSSNDNTDDNKNYIKLIDEINILKSAMQSKDKMLINRILISIQEYYAILFDSMVNKCKGKTGLIRSQILSKNADFSGRAVIVVDPLIRPSQIGVPRNMLIKLFYPWIIYFINNNNEYKSALKQCGVEPNISNMYNIINSNLFEKKIETKIIDIFNRAMMEVIKDKVIIAKRDPSLHKFSVRGFYPVPVDDSSIHVCPAVCDGFNADFDGDQMAVFVPLTNKAQNIVKNEMLSTKNLYAIRDDLSLTVGKDYVLGVYVITRDDAEPNSTPVVLTENTDIIDVLFKEEMFNRLITFRKKTNTIGRRVVELIFKDRVSIDGPVNEKSLAKHLKKIADEFPDELEETIYKVVRVTSVISSVYGGTMSMKDFEMEDDLKKRRDEIVAHPDKYDVGSELKKITNEFMDRTTKSSQLPTLLVNSGARGNAGSIQQISVAKGYIADANGKTLPDPVGSCFIEGFKPVDYFTSSYGNRKGIIDRVGNTRYSGYLQRQMIFLAVPVKCGDKDDCKTNRFLKILLTEEYLKVLNGRILKNGEILTEEYAKKNNLIDSYIEIYSPMYCKEPRVCKKCYPEYYRKKLYNCNNIGVIAADTIGERGSQLIMRQFHCFSAQTMIILNQNNKYMISTLKSLYDKYERFAIDTLNNTQREIDLTDKEFYVYDNGEFTKVLKIIRHRRNPDSKMVFIKTFDEHNITCQDNHRMLINGEFKEVKEINVNKDRLSINDFHVWQDVNHECFIDGYLLGAFLGNGYIGIDNDGITPKSINYLFSESQCNDNIRNKLLYLLSNTIDVPIINNNNIKVFDIEITTKLYNECGRYSYYKHLPSDFIYYNDNILSKILCGLIDTNGHICIQNEDKEIISSITFEMTSEAIINQLAIICKKFNIKYEINIKDNNKEFKHQIYILHIYPIKENESIFKDSIKLQNLDYMESIVANNNDENSNVIAMYNDISFDDELLYVYDLETETHQYNANGLLSKNTGGASSILYFTKEVPELKGVIGQENNTLIALKPVKLELEYYDSSNVQEYNTNIFTVTNLETDVAVNVEFPATINFNTFDSTGSVKSHDDILEIQYDANSIIGEISADATDTTASVKLAQSMFDRPAMRYGAEKDGEVKLVIELFEIFKMAAKIDLVHFEILVSQVMRDPKNERVPYRFGDMTEKPKLVGIKNVSMVESSRRGILFEDNLYCLAS